MWLPATDESFNLDVNVDVPRNGKNVQGIVEHGGRAEVYERWSGAYARSRRKIDELIVVGWPEVERKTRAISPKLSPLGPTQDKNQSFGYLNRAKQVSEWPASRIPNQLWLVERRTWYESQHHPQWPATAQRNGGANLWTWSKSKATYQWEWAVKTLEESIACKWRRTETVTG